MLDAWLRSALTNSGLSQSEVAKRLTHKLGRQIDRSAVNKMSKGKRAIAGDELLAISEITETPAPQPGDGAIQVELPIAGLPIVGTIQAGAWLDTAMMDPVSEPEMVQLLPDRRFPRARQYVLLVRGDSMSREWPDGSYVTVVDFAESGLALKDGLTVHVERHEASGQRVEITLKKVKIINGRFWLYPHSDNAQWKPFALTGRDGASDIIVKGVVTGGWKQSDL